MADFDWRDNWHLRHIAAKLQDVVEGRCRRLILTIPFRHGKSQLGSRFLPPYFLGRYPDKTVIGTSHSPDLAEAMSRDAKKVLTSDNFSSIFPDVRISRNSNAAEASRYKDTNKVWEIVGRRGSYRAFGAGQGIQGVGGDLIIIDDVFGKRSDAFSARRRQEIKDWYDTDVVSRLAKDGAIVIINTRMHHDDLIGYLLDVEKQHPEIIDERWEVINFPALKTEKTDPDDPRQIGEALWPWRKSREELEALKTKRPDIFWGSYQGEPTPPGGTIVKVDDVRYWDRLPGLRGQWVQSWDLRAGGQSASSSYAVGQLWFKPAAEPANAYLVAQRRGRWDINETLDQLLDASQDSLWARASEKLIEAQADGRAVIPMLQNRVAGIVPINPGQLGKKEARLQRVAPFFRSGNVYIPDQSVAPWVREFVHELTTFPGSANDDQVDAASQAIGHLLISTDDGRSSIYDGWIL